MYEAGSGVTSSNEFGSLFGAQERLVKMTSCVTMQHNDDVNFNGGALVKS